MVILQDNAPEVKTKFRMDDFVRENYIKVFLITLDQAHEQNTKLMKRRWWTNEPY